MLLVVPGNGLRWDKSLKCVGCQVSMVSGTGMFLWIGELCIIGQGLNNFKLGVVALYRFVSIIGSPTLIVRSLVLWD